MTERPRFHRPVLWATALLASVYAIWFSAYTCIQHMRFQTFAFDLGTFDQGIWLAGHGTDYFVTVRGLPLLGDHVRLFSFFLAPLYWIWDDVRALLVAQSVFIAAGAFFVCRISLRMLPSRPFVALALAASFLLHPANQNLNLDHAHPDAFAMTLILASVDFLGAGRLVAFSIAAALAMSCKEDVPLVYAALGAVMMLDRARRRLGFTIAAVSSSFFLFSMFVILPYFNRGAGFFRLGRKGFLGSFGLYGTEATWLLEKLTGPESITYLLQIGATNLFVFLLAPLAIVPALPQIAANLLSDAGYMRNLEYHYHTSVVAFLYVGTVAALASTERIRARLAERRAPAAAILGGLLAIAPLAFVASAVATNLAWSRVPVTYPGVVFRYYEAYRKDPQFEKARSLLDRIPPDAVVTADYTTLPHISHRRRIYMYPNPFEVNNWGVDGENMHNPDDVEYIVLRKVHSIRTVTPLVQQLLDEKAFERIAGDDQMALYRRIDAVRMSEKATCGDYDGDGAVTREDVRLVGMAIIRRRPCPMRVCDADGNGKLENRDVLTIGRRMKDAAMKLSCPAVD
jgi:uncharacterized membrane protein